MQPPGAGAVSATNHGSDGPCRRAGPAVPPRLLAVALFALVAVTFWRVHRFDYLNWDDPRLVRANPYVQSGLSRESVRWAFAAELLRPSHYSDYRLPLTHLAHLLDVELFGPGPAGPHVVNVLIHGLNAALLFLFLHATTGHLGPSTFVAALYAVHPVHVESVAWISERKDVLAGFFWMSGLLCYAAWQQRRSRLGRAGVWAAFVLGQMCKPIFLVFPFVLLLLDVWPLKRLDIAARPGAPKEACLQRLVLEKLPLLLLAAAMAVMTLRAAGSAVAGLEQMPLRGRLANAAGAYIAYLRRLFLPLGLSPFYPPAAVPPGRALLSAAALLVGSIWIGRRMRRAPYLPVGWCWFLGVLLPVVGLVQVGPQQTADRFLYLPAIGIYVAVAWAGRDLGQRLPARCRTILLAGCASATVLVFLAVTHQYLPHWENATVFWQRSLAASGRNNGIAHNNLADALLHQGSPREALPHARQAVALLADRDFAHLQLARVLRDTGRTGERIAALEHAVRQLPDSMTVRLALADTFMDQGRTTAASAHYAEALRREPANARAHAGMSKVVARRDGAPAAVAYLEAALGKCGPDPADIHMALGVLALEQGDEQAAETHFRAALDTRPAAAAALANLGDVARKRGQIDTAIQWYRQSLRYEPGRTESRVNLGAALLQYGQVREAVQEFAAVAAQRPNWAPARANLGHALLAAGAAGQAAEQYRRALEIDSSLHDVRLDLGTAYARMGDLERASATFRAVIQAEPTLVEAYANLARIAMFQGRKDQALELWQTALRQRPGWPPALTALRNLGAGTTAASPINGQAPAGVPVTE